MSLNHEKTQKEHNEFVMRPVTKQNAINTNKCVYDMRDCRFLLQCRKRLSSSGLLLYFCW